jgi:hypoxanthine phosphoribosyltransferase
METVNISWQQIENEVNKIANTILSKKDNFDVVIGLSRGGLIPGVMLSHKLNLPFIPLVWQTRDGSKKDKKLLKQYNKETTLVIDDLIDSGKTFYEVIKVAPNVKYAALFDKQISLNSEYFSKNLDYCGSLLYNDNRWLIFPWESS